MDFYIQKIKVIIKIFYSVMSKTETDAAGIKAAYIRPSIACFAVEFSLCAGSPPFDGGHKKATPGGPLEELEDEA